MCLSQQQREKTSVEKRCGWENTPREEEQGWGWGVVVEEKQVLREAEGRRKETQECGDGDVQGKETAAGRTQARPQLCPRLTAGNAEEETGGDGRVDGGAEGIKRQEKLIIL